jgi:hypothetical protein
MTRMHINVKQPLVIRTGLTNKITGVISQRALNKFKNKVFFKISSQEHHDL